ncbi:MAG TPA: flagellar hook-basal body complex protein FliE [Patescibacteria group bacterium]|nr:flagellar hook-basal body complex protein FliE [Patescibacteria group bacterium]
MRIEPLQMTPVKAVVQVGNIAGDIAANPPEKSFGAFLTDALGQVNQLQNDSRQASVNLATGKLNDISEVAIISEKASLALQMTMQVRNKVVESYQEVMRMQV